MRQFRIRWVAATLGGFVGSFVALVAAIGLLTGGEGPEAVGVPFEVAFPIVVAASVAVLAAAQWLVMRRSLPGRGRWVPATSGSMLVSAFVIFGFEGEGTTLLSSLAWGLAHALTVAVLVGSAQWWVIRDLDTTRQWIRASMVAWLAAEVVGNTAGWLLDGGVGLMVLIVVWAGLTARPMFAITRGASAAETVADGTGARVPSRRSRP
jgi:hypothetical protein